MKLFFGIVLVLMVLVSACGQQAAPAEDSGAAMEDGDAMEDKGAAMEDGDAMEDKGAAMEDGDAMEDKGAAMETTANEVRAVGSGAFDPAAITISAGSSVTWLNNAGDNMVVLLFKDGRSYMNTQKFNDGEKVELEFAEAGEYQYWQNIAYSGDGGTITVE
jgi:plastocyanin